MKVRFNLLDRDDGRVVLDADSCPEAFGEERTLVFEGCTEADYFSDPSEFSFWENGKAFKVTRSKPSDPFGVEVDGWTLIDKGFQITGIYKTYKDLEDFEAECV